MLFLLPIFLIGRITFIKIKKKKVKLINEVIITIFSLYIIGLASQTIIPRWDMGVYSDTGEFYFHTNASMSNSKINLIPFHTIFQYLFKENENVDVWGNVSLLNISANMLLFSPLGFFVPLIWRNKDSLRGIFLLGVLSTCFIEFLQYFIGRSSDIDDVLLNTIGVLLGYGIFIILKQLHYHVNKRKLVKLGI